MRQRAVGLIAFNAHIFQVTVGTTSHACDDDTECVLPNRSSVWHTPAQKHTHTHPQTHGTYRYVIQLSMRRRGWSLRPSADGIMDHSVRAHFRIESPPLPVPDGNVYPNQPCRAGRNGVQIAPVCVCACVAGATEQRSGGGGWSIGWRLSFYEHHTASQWTVKSQSSTSPNIISRTRTLTHTYCTAGSDNNVYAA